MTLFIETIDPAYLDSLMPVDTGLPRQICPRQATAAQLASQEAPTLVIPLGKGICPPGGYALLTIDDPVQQVFGPLLPDMEVELYAGWIAAHREDLLEAWRHCRFLDHLRFLDWTLLTTVGASETGLPHWIAMRERCDGNEPTLVVLLDRQAYSAFSFALLSLNEPVHQLFGPALDDAHSSIHLAWIRLNRDALLAHWRGEASSREALDHLRVLPQSSIQTAQR